MATYNTLRLILRLSVIILTISMNNNKVRNGVVSVASQLVLQPLWNISDSLNGTNPCFVDENVGKGMVRLTGSSDLSCSLQVTAPQGTRIQLQLPRNHNNSFGYSFLHIERLEDLQICLNKYVIIENQPAGCTSTLSHPNIVLVLNSIASIYVGDVPSMEISPQCPEFDIQRFNENVSHTFHCNNVKGYTKKIVCEQGLSVDCRLNFQTHRNCNAILGPREVAIKCSEFGPLQDQTKMIMYPHSFTTLDLSSNRIVEIGVDSFLGLEALQILHLENNNLAKLNEGSFHGLFNLQILFLHENKLSFVSGALFHDLLNLKELCLFFNSLHFLPNELFVGLINLEKLKLDENQIMNLTEGLFAGLHGLKKLTIGANMLKSITSGMFYDLSNLEILSLQYNMLTTLEDGVFQDLSNLELLSINDNNIVELNGQPFKGLNKLNTLELFNNRIRHLKSYTFDNLTNIQVIWINNNEIINFPDGTLFSLKNLLFFIFSHNRLNTLPNHLYQRSTESRNFDIPNKLTFLTMGGNNINEIPSTFFKGLENLQQLILDRNTFTKLDPRVFQDLSDLNLLSLSQNMLTKLSPGCFHGLTNLQLLVLNSNELESLGTDVFRGLDNLQILYLSINNLTQLSVDVFKYTTNLTFIDLSKNNLHDVPGIKLLVSLSFINVEGNLLTRISQSSLSFLGNNSEVFASQHEICDCYVPPGVFCSASDKRSPYLTCGRLLDDTALAVMMWLMGINAFGGNLFVLAWRWLKRDSHSNKVNTILLSNLATSDLLMGVYMLIIASADSYFGNYFPMQSETWRSGITCRIAGALSITASEASVFFVMLISIDRFICIRFPYSTRRMGKKSVAIIVTITWLISFAIGIVPSILSGRNFKFYDNSHVCIGLPLALTKTYSNEVINEERLFFTKVLEVGYFVNVFTSRLTGLVNGLYFAVAVFLGVNCICYLIILGCYIEIVRAVKKSSKQVGRNRDMKEQITLTVKVTAIVATDFLCWFPIILLGILVQVRVVELPPSVYAWCVTFVLPINSAINPYLYTISEIISNAKKKRSEKSKTSKNQSCPSVSTKHAKVQSREVSSTSGGMGNKDNNNTSV